MPSKYLPAKHRDRIFAFLRKYDQHFFGLRAAEWNARMFAKKAGLEEIIAGHMLTRLAKRAGCKYWRQFPVRKNIREGRTHELTRSQWNDLYDCIGNMQEKFDHNTTPHFVYMKLRCLKIKCSLQATREALKFLKIKLPDEP